MKKKLACPCCGFLTIKRRGQYDICPVCFWEDDGGDDDYRYSGPNHMTLGEARQNFVRLGACDESALAFVRLPSVHELP